jgi:hypothetical protein
VNVAVVSPESNPKYLGDRVAVKTHAAVTIGNKGGLYPICLRVAGLADHINHLKMVDQHQINHAGIFRESFCAK